MCDQSSQDAQAPQRAGNRLEARRKQKPNIQIANRSHMCRAYNGPHRSCLSHISRSTANESVATDQVCPPCCAIHRSHNDHIVLLSSMCTSIFHNLLSVALSWHLNRPKHTTATFAVAYRPVKQSALFGHQDVRATDSVPWCAMQQSESLLTRSE